jgi:hypothetical protein
MISSPSKPAGIVGLEVSPAAAGMMAEQSVKVLRSNPSTDILDMAARKRVVIKSWSAANACQWHAVLEQHWSDMRVTITVREHKPRVTSQASVAAHPELSTKG